MKSLALILRIIAIVLNVVFPTYVAIQMGTDGFSTHFLLCMAQILILGGLPVTLIAIVFTFVRRIRILTAGLKTIAIMLNVALLVCLVCLAAAMGVAAEGFWAWFWVLLVFALPVVNILAVVLTFRKGESYLQPSVENS